MKQAIEHLLQSIEAGASGPKAHSPHAEKVRVALDAGVFDYLMGHSANEHPKHERVVLTLVELDDKRQWRLNAWYKSEGFGDGWLFRHNPVIRWQELPPTGEPK